MESNIFSLMAVGNVWYTGGRDAAGGTQVILKFYVLPVNYKIIISHIGDWDFNYCEYYLKRSVFIWLLMGLRLRLW